MFVGWEIMGYDKNRFNVGCNNDLSILIGYRDGGFEDG